MAAVLVEAADLLRDRFTSITRQQRQQIHQYRQSMFDPMVDRGQCGTLQLVRGVDLMKYFLSALLCFVATMAFGAVPSYTAFIGTNGITVSSNPPTGKILIDGSGAGAGITTNANQFGAAAKTLTLKDGVNATNPIVNGVFTIGSFGNTFGLSNRVQGELTFFIEDIASDDNWHFSDQLFINQRASAGLLTVSNMPGSGSIVAIDSGGATYRTNAAGGTQALQAGGTNISASATGQTFFVSKNLEQFYTNVNGQVSVLTRDKTNHTFLSYSGYDMRLGWFINDASGDSIGTGTNFGFYDHTQDRLTLWTFGTSGNMYFADDLYVPSMDGNGTVVVQALPSGKLQTTNTLNVSNINTASFFTTNGIQGNWPDGYVIWSSNGWLMGESTLTYDRGDNILTGISLVGNNLTASNIFATSPGSSIVGVTNGSDAVAGVVGEYLVATNYGGSVGTSGQYYDVASMAITKGDWDVSAVLIINRNSATFGSSAFVVGVSTTTGNDSAGLIAALNYTDASAVVPLTFTEYSISVPSVRFSSATNATLYMKALVASYTVATPVQYGRMSARRVR